MNLKMILIGICLFSACSSFGGDATARAQRKRAEQRRIESERIGKEVLASQARKREADAEAERIRLRGNKITELDITNGIIINARCLSTNVVLSRILPAINKEYGKTKFGGIVKLDRYDGYDAQDLTLDDFKDFLSKGGIFQFEFTHKIKPYQKYIGGVTVIRGSPIIGGGRIVGRTPTVSYGTPQYETITTRKDTIKLSLKNGMMVTFDPNFLSEAN